MKRLLTAIALLTIVLTYPAQSAEVSEAMKAKWEAGGRFGSSLGCIVRWVSNLEKISLTDSSTGTILANMPATIALSAAQGEYEGFQIVLSPLEDFARQISVKASSLKSSAGSIPASEITINPVGYVLADSGELCPDPLLSGKIPELTSGENQPVWITIHVPRGTAPGLYKGKIIISSKGRKSVAVPVSIKVRNFEIPKKISLRSSFWLFRDQINRFYNIKEVKLDDYMKWVDFALEHRLCPIDVYEGSCEQLLDVAIENTEPGITKGSGTLPNPKPNFTKWDKYIDHMLAGGASTIHLGQSHHQGTFFADKDNPISSPTQVARVVDNLKILRDHYKKRGIFDLHYMQLRDETSAPDSLNVYRDVQAQMPDVKLLLTAQSPESRPFLRIPCPLTPSFDAAWRDEVKSKGGEYWWYVCCGPDANWANLFIPQKAVQHRVLFWQTWQHGVDGILYWGLNYWAMYEHRWPQGTQGPQSRRPGTGDAAFRLMPPFPSGDGFSMYPGATPSEPLSSIRLENMRDGEEDYEYFILLDKLIAHAEKSGQNSASIQAAKTARNSALALIPGMLNYSKNPVNYLNARDRVADAIENLNSRL